MARFKGVLPDSVLRKMNPEDRKTLGKAGITMAEAAAQQEAKRERQLHDQIENWLRLRGITYRHDRMDKRTTCRKGWPDFSFAIHGRATALEVKRPGEMPTEEQVECMAGLSRDGWSVAVVCSLDEAIHFVKSVEVGS